MIQRLDPGPRMSEASIHHGIVYLAGQIPETLDADIEVQTAEVLAAIDDLLARAGSDKSKILRAQIFLADINDFAGMNRAWDAWVVAGNAPARATVEAKRSMRTTSRVVSHIVTGSRSRAKCATQKLFASRGK